MTNIFVYARKPLITHGIFEINFVIAKIMAFYD